MPSLSRMRHFGRKTALLWTGRGSLRQEQGCVTRCLRSFGLTDHGGTVSSPWIQQSLRHSGCLVSMRSFSTPATETRIGVVQKIRHRKEESNWCLAEVAAVGTLRDQNDFLVKGVMPTLRKGERYDFHGTWDTKKEFDVQRLESSDPFQIKLESLKVFLEKEVSQVGPKLASRFVVHFAKQFGEKTLEILLGSEESKEKDQDVEGISKELVRKMVLHCRRHQDKLDLFLRLGPLGISYTKFNKILEHVKNHIYKVRYIIDSDPYALCQVDTVSFQNADTIALNNPHFLNDGSTRIDAGVVHMLQKKADAEGSTALGLKEAVKGASELLEVDSAIVESNLRNGDLPNIEYCAFSGKPYAQLRTVAKAEQEIADFYKIPRSKRSGLKPEDFRQAALRCSYEEFSPSQEQAIDAVAKHGTCVITCGPGTGKSAIIPALLTIMPDKVIEVAAPTGRAAQRINEMLDALKSNVNFNEAPRLDQVNAKTIHRLLNVKVMSHDCDLVIIDEASMVDTKLLADLIRQLPKHCDLVLVGDKDQLPSISSGKVLEDVIRSGKVPVIRLDKFYRQESESSIVKLAQHVNEGKFDKCFIDSLQAKDKHFKFVEIDKDEPIGPVLETILSDTDLDLPDSYASTHFQILAPMKKGDDGIEAINTYFQAQNPQPRTKLERFKIGDKVLQTRNNYDLDLFNGMVGTVKDDRSRGGIVSLIVDFDGEEIELESSACNDLQLGYGITIHRSQGSEYLLVIIVLTMRHRWMLYRKLLYTAITRPKPRLVIVGSLKACELAAQDNQNTRKERLTLLLERLVEER